ncbi:MAG: YicC family protein [candidate division Zixibacteria bacterium]|nr:YicC family protein [candidate division Zixibacteria bacterium]
MNSMTGFGKAEIKTKSVQCSAEITSFNNRFLELSIRLPRQISALEAPLRELISKKVSRGKVTVFVNYEKTGPNSTKYSINAEALEAYSSQLKKIKKKLGLKGEIEIGDLLSFPSICEPPSNSTDVKEIWPQVKKAVEQALGQLSKMRSIEGSALAKDMASRVGRTLNMLKAIKSASSNSAKNYRKKLSKRIEEVLANGKLDRTRLEQEVAILAEKADISEECTRFESHARQFGKTLKAKGEIGKKLNFILQEMNREVNTMSSKCSEYAVAKVALEMKEEVEKLREQVQNVE